MKAGSVQASARREFVEVRQNTVIPAEAGIQTYSVHTTSLDSGFRRNDEKIKLVDGLLGG